MIAYLKVLCLLCSFSSTSAGPSKEDRIRGAFYGALVGDALCLGSHYEYDATAIKKAYGGTISRYMAPGESMGGTTHGVGWGRRNYHPGAKAGDQTDYGEYNVLVLEHLAAHAKDPKPFDVKDFAPRFTRRVTQGWKNWVDSMTKRTMQQLNNGVPINQLGGNSNAMALRFAPAFAYYSDETDIIDTARKTMFTHRERTAHLGAKFFAQVTYRIIHNGLTPRKAIDEVSRESDPWIQRKVDQAIKKFEEATDPTMPLSKDEFVDDKALTSMARLWDVGKSEPIKVGKASPTEGTLPGSVYHILKYEDDLIGALKGNAMVGGDNASRSVAIGMVLGAAHGISAIPEDLKQGLNHWKTSEAMLETLPLLAGGGAKDEL